jgi:predicted TIM-barrel fold metal-dependent hydrolase
MIASFVKRPIPMIARTMAERFTASGGGYGAALRDLTLAEARDMGITRGPWWGMPAANTLDRATALLPKLLYERLDELGLDYSVLYTTLGFWLIGIEDEELRRASCRALNRLRADMTAGFEDRLTAAAVIHMHTPEEAIEELEYAVKELGMKTAKNPDAARFAYTLDVYGIDSDYDYDPFWAKCQELGIAPSSLRTSGSNRKISARSY